MITAYLNDIQLPPLGVPVTITPLNNAVDVVTADNNMYTSFAVGSQKRSWELKWESLTKDDYDAIKAIFDEQFVTYEYPLLSIPFYEVEDVPVRMTINPQEVYTNCGDVQNITIGLRESVVQDSS